MTDTPLADRPVDPFIPHNATPDEIAAHCGIDPSAAAAWPSKPTKTAKIPALALTLGGAPDAPHRIDGLAGFHRPGSPTPCDGPGEPPLDQAEALHAQPGCPVALVYLTDAQAKAARRQRAADLAAATGAFLQARDEVAPDTGEVEHLADELNAIQGS